MPWVKTDHNIHQHPKFQDMPGDEFQIWHQGLSYAAEWWTDGFIPASRFPKKSQQKFIEDLQKRNLWHRISVNGIEGFQIHDYEKYQTLKKDYEEKKAKDRTRKREDEVIPNGIQSESKEIPVTNPDGIQLLRELKELNATNSAKPQARYRIPLKGCYGEFVCGNCQESWPCPIERTKNAIPF